MAKKYVKSHIKRAFETALEIFAYNQAVEKKGKQSFDSAVQLYEQLSGMTFNINDALVDESEREDFIQTQKSEPEETTPGVVAEAKTTEPVLEKYEDQKSLTDKILFVVNRKGKLSRSEIVDAIANDQLTEKQINATFYSMVQRKLITAPVGYNGFVSINPDRPERKKKKRNEK